MRGYEELPGLSDWYLEDSWVLAVDRHNEALDFRVEAVLRESHPEWTRPKPGEVHAYKLIVLRFPYPEIVDRLAEAIGPPATDAGEGVDFGHIDRFVWEERTYELEGDWGHLRLIGEAPIVVSVSARPRL